MKVVHLCLGDNGGAGLCCRRISDALREKGIDSKVVVNRIYYSDPYVYKCNSYRNFFYKLISRCFRAIGLKVTEYNKILDLSFKNGCTYSRPISYIDLRKNKYVKEADIIHYHWGEDFVDFPTFFKGINTPIVITLHDENIFYGIAHYKNEVLQNNYYEIKYKHIKYDILQGIKNLGVVFLSQDMYNEYNRNLMIKNASKVIINNPVDTSIFKPGNNKQEIRAKLGLKDCQKVFVFVAYQIFDKRKGLEKLLRALDLIGNKDYVVLAIGNNSNSIQLKNVVSVGAINDQEKLSEVISCADYYVMPSLQEAFSQSPLEAMACGVPAVVFPCSGTKELINDFNGIRCEDFSVESLKNGIEKAVNISFDPVKIRKDIEERFSKCTIANKYIKLYNNLLNKK